MQRSIPRPVTRPTTKSAAAGIYRSEVSLAGLFGAGEQGLFVDFSDLSSMFQDSAGTTPVTAAGQQVGLVRDKSGRGNDLTQSTAASRPTLRQDATTGAYYLEFDGTDDWLRTTGNLNLSGTDKLVAAYAAQVQDTSATKALIELSAAGDSNNGAFYHAFLNTERLEVAIRSTGTAADYTGSTNPLTGPVVVSMALDYAKTVMAEKIQLRANGAAPLGYPPAGNSVGTPANFGTYPLFIGRRNGSTWTFKGNLYGLILRGAQSTFDDILACELFMARRIGVSIA